MEDAREITKHVCEKAMAANTGLWHIPFDTRLEATCVRLCFRRAFLARGKDQFPAFFFYVLIHDNEDLGAAGNKRFITFPAKLCHIFFTYQVSVSLQLHLSPITSPAPSPPFPSAGHHENQAFSRENTTVPKPVYLPFRSFLYPMTTVMATATSIHQMLPSMKTLKTGPTVLTPCVTRIPRTLRPTTREDIGPLITSKRFQRRRIVR